MTRKKKTRRRAPGAPRRFKTAFIFFSITKHREIREQIEKQGRGPSMVSTTTVAKMVSEQWKNLSKEERATWDEIAAKDKARYEVEKQMYKGPWQVPTNEGRDPMAPRRPCSAFVSFLQAKRGEVKREHPEASANEIMRLVVQKWYGSPERDQFLEEEAKRLAIYKKKMKAWRQMKQKKPEVVLATKREERAWKALEIREKNGVDGKEVTRSSKEQENPRGGGISASRRAARVTAPGPIEDENHVQEEARCQPMLVPSTTTNMPCDGNGDRRHEIDDQKATLLRLDDEDTEGGDEIANNNRFATQNEQEAALMSLLDSDDVGHGIPSNNGRFVPHSLASRLTLPGALGSQPTGRLQYARMLDYARMLQHEQLLTATRPATGLAADVPLEVPLALLGEEPIGMELDLFLLRKMRAENEILQSILERRQLESSPSTFFDADLLSSARDSFAS